MLIEMLQGKLHQAVVTDTKLEYMGSLTVDLDLIEQAGMREFQKIQLLNINNGSRLETYLLAGRRGSRELIVNGAAARHAHPGDRVIVAAFGLYDPKELVDHKPIVLLLDRENRVIDRQ